MFVAHTAYGTVDVIDARHRSDVDHVVERFALPGCDGAHGVQLVASPPRAFIGCESNNKLMVFDLVAKRVIGSVSVGNTPGVLAYDEPLGRVYVACEDGSLWVIDAALVRSTGDSAGDKPDLRMGCLAACRELVLLYVVGVVVYFAIIWHWLP